MEDARKMKECSLLISKQFQVSHFAPPSFTMLIQKQPREMFCEKSILKNFTKFTGKRLYWS